MGCVLEALALRRYVLCVAVRGHPRQVLAHVGHDLGDGDAWGLCRGMGGCVMCDGRWEVCMGGVHRRCELEVGALCTGRCETG